MAFKSTHFDRIERNVNILFNRMEAATPFHMSHEDGISLIAPAEDRVALLNAHKFARVSSNSTDSVYFRLPVPSVENWTGATAMAGLSIAFKKVGTAMPLMPRKAELQEDRPELRASVQAWFDEQVKLKVEFGATLFLLRQLNAMCTEPAQVRFIMPAIMALINMDKGLQSLAEKMGPYKAPKVAVQVDPAIRVLAKNATQMITAASLLPDEMPDSTNAACYLSVQVVDSVKHHGFVFTPM